jgi:hypothetical protein
MSREQRAERSHSIKTVDSSFERVEEFKYLGTTLTIPLRVEEFKYLGTTLTNQNSIQEEIKSRLKSGNACYHSVQNLLSSSLLYR